MIAAIAFQQITLYKYIPRNGEAGWCRGIIRHYRTPYAIDKDGGYWCVECVAALRRKGVLELIDNTQTEPEDSQPSNSELVQELSYEQKILNCLTQPKNPSAIANEVGICRTYANKFLNKLFFEGKLARKSFKRKMLYVIKENESILPISPPKIKKTSRVTENTLNSYELILKALEEKSKTVKELSIELNLTKGGIRYLARQLEVQGKISVKIIGGEKNLYTLINKESTLNGIPKGSNLETEIFNWLRSQSKQIQSKQIFDRYEISAQVGTRPEHTRQGLLDLVKSNLIYSRRQGNTVTWYCLIEHKEVLDKFITTCGNPIREGIINLLKDGVQDKREIVKVLGKEYEQAITYQISQLCAKEVIYRKIINQNQSYLALPEHKEYLEKI